MLRIYLGTISLSIIFLFTSCKEEVKVTLPYEEEKVINILGDMHFARSAAKVYNIEIRDSMKLIFESQVYSINGITETDYQDLVNILESDMNLYYDIEKKVHKYLKNVQNDKN